MNKSTTSDSNDEILLAQFIETGDATLLGKLYSQYMPFVYGLCLKYLNSAPDAEDAVMEIFEMIVQKISTQRVRNFRTWLWSVAKNHCLQRLRRQKRTIRTDFNDNVMEFAPLVHLLNDNEGDETAISTLERCMEKLPERQREAVNLFFVEKQSYADIADTTLANAKAVKSHIQNGKRNLRICLEKNGVKL
jgi:RNA polymerase sigma-70 factor (ECF subfamily)